MTKILQAAFCGVLLAAPQIHAQTLEALLSPEPVTSTVESQEAAARNMRELMERFQQARTVTEKLMLLPQMRDLLDEVRDTGTLQSLRAEMQKAVESTDDILKPDVIRVLMGTGTADENVPALVAAWEKKQLAEPLFQRSLAALYPRASKPGRMEIMKLLLQGDMVPSRIKLVEVWGRPSILQKMDTEELQAVRGFLARWQGVVLRLQPGLGSMVVRNLQLWLSAMANLMLAEQGTARADAMLSIVLDPQADPRLLVAWILSSDFKSQAYGSQISQSTWKKCYERLHALQARAPDDEFIRAAWLVMEQTGPMR